MISLSRNIGYKISGVVGFKGLEKDFGSKQKEAWELVKRSIDQGIPCYGWEMAIPEYYVVYGYDDDGYYFTGPGNVGVLVEEGYKPWRELGASDIGVVEMYSGTPGQAVDDARTVKDALEFALDHAAGKWVHPNYGAGLAGYDLWIDTLENGTATDHGMAFNTAVWNECRFFAPRFLKEARERLNGETGPLFEEAIGHYQTVQQNLQQVREMFPFPAGSELSDKERCQKAVECLKDARKAEESGLKSLEEIVAAL